MLRAVMPQGVHVTGYVPNLTPLPVLLLSFAAIAAIVVYTALSLAEDAAPWLRYSRRDRFVFCWFVLCGFLHCFFEGYFVINHASIPRSQSLFAQLWREYSLCDSRYLSSDPFMLCIESITAVVLGPLCFAIAGCLVRRHKLRQLLQAVTCTAHLQGVALYYGTCYYEYRYAGVSHSRPEFLYWGIYLVGFNAPWVVVPAVLLVDSAKAIYRSIKVVESIESLLREGASLHHEMKKFK